MLFLKIVLVRLGFELRASVFAKQTLYYLSQASSPLYLGYLEMGVSQTICPDWPWTLILPISTFQVARIIGMSHWHLAYFILFINFLKKVLIIFIVVLGGGTLWHLQKLLHYIKYIFTFDNTGVWIKALCLLGRHTTSCTTLPALHLP
jgi:hypothetical protein